MLSACCSPSVCSFTCRHCAIGRVLSATSNQTKSPGGFSDGACNSACGPTISRSLAPVDRRAHMRMPPRRECGVGVVRCGSRWRGSYTHRYIDSRPASIALRARLLCRLAFHKGSAAADRHRVAVLVEADMLKLDNAGVAARLAFAQRHHRRADMDGVA